MVIWEYTLKRKKVGEVDTIVLNTIESAIQYCTGALEDYEQEHFITVFLNTRNRIIGHNIVAKGMVDRINVHAREVFRLAILKNTSKVIIAHNHPSGDCRPSSNDKEITTRLIRAGKVLGIEVIDHIIIGDTHYSFCQEGKI